MLISPTLVSPDPIFAILFDSKEPIEHQPGVIEINHHNGDSLLPPGQFEKYPELSDVSCYGVADNYQQVLEKCPELLAEGRQFVLMFCPVIKANEPASGGWRWHKWGEYIGTHEPQHEYLYDEEGIEQVICFHIFEKE